MSVPWECKLDSDLPMAPEDFKDIRTDATILIPSKYNGDFYRGLRNLHAFFAHLSIFLHYNLANLTICSDDISRWLYL